MAACVSLYDGRAVSLWWKSTKVVVADEPHSDSQSLPFTALDSEAPQIVTFCA